MTVKHCCAYYCKMYGVQRRYRFTQDGGKSIRGVHLINGWDALYESTVSDHDTRAREEESIPRARIPDVLFNSFGLGL